MSLSIQRDDFVYLARPNSKGGPMRVHAVEHTETGLSERTLCGMLWDEEWMQNPLRVELCGVCDKTIRSRMREAREAEVSNMLRSAGEGHALTLMREMLLGLSEAYGLALSARDAADRAVSQIHAIRKTMFLLVYDQKDDFDGNEEAPG